MTATGKKVLRAAVLLAQDEVLGLRVQTIPAARVKVVIGARAAQARDRVAGEAAALGTRVPSEIAKRRPATGRPLPTLLDTAIDEAVPALRHAIGGAGHSVQAPSDEGTETIAAVADLRMQQTSMKVSVALVCARGGTGSVLPVSPM